MTIFHENFCEKNEEGFIYSGTCHLCGTRKTWKMNSEWDDYYFTGDCIAYDDDAGDRCHGIVDMDPHTQEELFAAIECDEDAKRSKAA